MSTSNGFASFPYILDSYTVRRSQGGVLLHTPYGLPPLYADRDVPLSLRTYQLTVPLQEVEPMVASTSPSALQIARFQKSLQGPSSSLLAHIAFPHETVLTPPPSISSRCGGDNNINNNGKGNNGRRRDNDFVSSFKSFAETSHTPSSATNHRLYTSAAREPELIPDVMMYPPGASTSSSSSTLSSYNYNFINNGQALPPDELGLQKASDIALLKIARNDGKAYGEDDVAYFRHFYSSIAYSAAEAASNRDSTESANSASKARKWAATMNRLRSSEVDHVSSRDKPHHPNHRHEQPQTTSTTTTSACTTATKEKKRLASREVLFTPATQGALAELRAFRSGLQALESRRRRCNSVLGREPSDFGNYQEREIDDPRISPFVF